MSDSSDAIGSAVDAQQNAVKNQIHYSILAKQLQAQRQSGEAAVDLLAAALELSKEAGKGANFDSIG